MLCDLAIAMLEEIASDFEAGALTWTVVDVGSRKGVLRHEQLSGLCGRRPLVPSIVINEQIAFDHIPDMEALRHALLQAMLQ